MTRLALFLASALVTSTVAVAGDDPIETRMRLMDSVGKASKAAGDMVKGEAEFDAVTAQLAMRTIFAVAAAFPAYFPEGSEQGGETEAAPAIWERREDFEAKAADLEADAWAAVEPAGQSLDALRPAFQAVAENCKGCHETYRVERN